MTAAFLEQVAITCRSTWSYSNFNNSCIAQILQQRNYAMVRLPANKQLLRPFLTALLNICNVTVTVCNTVASSILTHIYYSSCLMQHHCLCLQWSFNATVAHSIAYAQSSYLTQPLFTYCSSYLLSAAAIYLLQQLRNYCSSYLLNAAAIYLMQWLLQQLFTYCRSFFLLFT